MSHAIVTITASLDPPVIIISQNAFLTGNKSHMSEKAE